MVDLEHKFRYTNTKQTKYLNQEYVVFNYLSK